MMEQEKENAVEKHTSRRNNRRSSILKESPGRKPLVVVESNRHSRRSLKRVSFADTNTIKEFLATMGASTEWNSTYEAPAPQDSSASMDVTSLGLKSDGVSETHIWQQEETYPDTAPENKLQMETSTFLNQFLNLKPSSDSLAETASGPYEEPAGDEPLSQSTENLCTETSAFLSQFLNMRPSSSSKPDEACEDYGNNPSAFLTSFLAMTPSADHDGEHGELTQKVNADMEMTYPGGQMPKYSGNDITKKITADMEMTCPAGQMPRYPEKDMTQKVTADMEMTCPANQIPKRSGRDITQKISADMEMTCPAGQIPRYPGNDMTQKVTADMEMTCPANQIPKRSSSDITQKITADMEMTCPAGQMPRYPGNNMTQKVTADMDMTCPANLIPQRSVSDMTQKITADMEMTCSARQMPRYSGNDMTQKITADMEMTCPANQIPKRSSSDMTQKITADMEITCPAGQMPRYPGNDMTQKATADMEMTCPANQIPKRSSSDMTQKIMADMEMTCPAGQMPRYPGSDMTQKVTADMEMTCPAGQMLRYPGSDLTQKITADMEMTCPANQVPKRSSSDMTQKITADMEMTCPAGQMPRYPGSDMTQKVTADMEMTCPAGQMPRYPGSDLTQKITADMEMTCPANQIPKRSSSDMTQKSTADMEMTCPAGQMPRYPGSDMTQKVTADMEMTCPAGQMPRYPGSDLTQKITADMEMTCPANQIPKRSSSDMTQKITADMEMTCSARQMPRYSGNDMTQKITADMEITCPAGQMPRYPGNDMTQKATADMEMTCPANQIPKRSSSDMTQKITADMEMTCPAGQMPRYPGSDMTQKVTADMEMTCPANQMPKKSSSDMTQKITADMEMTCPAGQIPRYPGNDMTQKVTADMEMTCSANQISNKSSRDMEITHPVGQLPRYPGNDMIQITADMEMTCPVVQMPRNAENGMEHENGADMEMTCPASQMPKLLSSDLTQKIAADVDEMYATGSNPSSCSSGMVEKITANMEMTCSEANVPELCNREVPRVQTTDNEIPVVVTNNKRRKSILRNKATVSETEDGAPRGERTVMFNLEPELHVSLNRPAEDTSNDDQPSKKEQTNAIVSNVSCMNETLGNKSVPIFQSFLEDPVKDMGEPEPLQTVERAETVEGNMITKAGGKRLQGESPDESSPKVLVTANGPVPSQSPSSIGQQVAKINETKIITTDMNQTCGDQLRLDITDVDAGHQSSKVAESPVKENQNHSVRQNTEPQSTSSGQSEIADELLEDINLDLENSGDSNVETWLHTGHASVMKPEEPSQNVSQKEPKSRRKSLAADALDSILPMMNSFAERVSMINYDESLLEETIHKEMALELEKEETVLEEHCMEIDSSSRGDEKERTSESQMHEGQDRDDPQEKSKQNSENSQTSIGDEPTATSLATETTLTVDEGVTHHVSTSTVVPQDSVSKDNDVQISLCDKKCDRPLGNQSLNLQTNLSLNDNRQPTEPQNADMVIDSQEDNIECKDSVPKGDRLVNERKEEEVLAESHTLSCVDQTSVTEVSAVSQGFNTLALNNSTVQTSTKVQKQNLSAHNVTCQCEICSSTEGCIIYQSRNGTWIVSKVSEGNICVFLQHTPLKLELKVSRCDMHWTVVTATWKPQASDIQNKCGRLVMSVLGCRLGAAVARLSGLVLCEAREALEQVVTAYNNVTDFILEMKLLAASHLTSFEPDSVKVTLFNLNAHVSVDIIVTVQPPEDSPEHPYTLQPTAQVTIGNLRHQTLDEAMCDISSGPRQLLRLIQAANSIVQNMSC